MKTKQYLQQLKWISLWVAIVFIAGCKGEIPPGTTPLKTLAVVKASTSIVEIIEQPQFNGVAGTVFARSTTTVSAKVMGQIKKVLVEEGERVAAGDVLVVIDDVQLSARRQQAEAAVAEANHGTRAARATLTSARSSLELAEKTLGRYEILLSKESVSLQEFDEVKARYDQASGGVSQAKAMVEASQNRVGQAKANLLSAKTTYGDAIVTAPYDAIVTGRFLHKGDLATPGAPIMSLETIGLSEVHMVLPESYLHELGVKDKLSVFIPSLKNEAMEGEVKAINSAADPSTRSFLVKVSLPDLPAIQTGMFARVLIPMGRTSMILVPETAVIRNGQLSGIYLVSSDQTAHFRLIRPGRSFGKRVEVLSGLKSGERYITAPGEKVADGVKVEES